MGCVRSRPNRAQAVGLPDETHEEALEPQEKCPTEKTPDKEEERPEEDEATRTSLMATKMVDLFDQVALRSLQLPLLSKHINKTLGAIQRHYGSALSVRLNEFTPECVLMEAIVHKFRQRGWLVALFEYGINPTGPGWVGKGDLVLVHPGLGDKPLALAVEAKILSSNSPNLKHTKVREQARTYSKKMRRLLDKDRFLDIRGLPLLAWLDSPQDILILRGWQVASAFKPFVPCFPST